MGGIGRDMKNKAEALGMRVQYFNRRQLDDEKSGGARYVTFEELLKTSDVLSLNLPLNVHSLLSYAEKAALFPRRFDPTLILEYRKAHIT